MNVADILGRAAGRAPGKPALVPLRATGDLGAAISYRDLDSLAGRVAGDLVGRGVEPGDRVAIVMGNVPEFPAAFYGALRAGAIAVPLNDHLAEPEIVRILADCRPRVLLAAGPNSPVVIEAGRAVESVDHAVVVDRDSDWPAPAAETEPAERAGDDIAVLCYTSGTTGAPKGAMLSHGNLLASLDQQMRVPGGRVEADDVVLIVLPLFHIFGLNVTLGLTVLNAATGVLVERFDPATTLQAIPDHSVSVVFGVPTMYSAWVAAAETRPHDLSTVRLACSGAAPLSPRVLKAARDVLGIDVLEGYGLTESAPSLTLNFASERPRPGSVGRPIPGVELRIVGDDGTDVELGDLGEVLARGPNVFMGYWNRPEETERALAGGWLHTGDVAVRDEDGYVYLVDRKRDLIIVSGFNVFPSEVENALLENPKVAEAAVVGVPHTYTGEAVKAYVVLQKGKSATEEEIRQDVATRLARFKCPESVELVPELPHLLTGKVLRRALR